jgi:YVTN family beta-propeller protein
MFTHGMGLPVWKMDRNAPGRRGLLHACAQNAVLATIFSIPLLPQTPHTDKAATGKESSQNQLSNELNRMPRHFANGSDLPNGWHITPAGKSIATVGDLVLNTVLSPDGRVLIVTHGGFQPHGIDVIDTATHATVQHIPLTSAYLGLAWSGDGKTLYVSGGNASGASSHKDPVAPVYEFSYANGRLSEQPTGRFVETIDPKDVWWTGVAYQPAKHLLYAANKGTGTGPGNIVVFDSSTHQIVTRIPVEITPYQALLSHDGKRLFVSNWSSESISVIDTATNTVIRSVHVGINPTAMALSTDGRLFIACSNDNTVSVVDTRKLEVIERISTTQTPLAPEGSTPNALAIDDTRHLLYVANADNNSLAVVHIENRAHSTVVGFVPTGWYPSALTLSANSRELFIGTSKGEEGHPDPKGPHSPLAADPRPGVNPYSRGEESVKTVQTGSIELLPVADLQAKLPAWTRQVTENTPYNDSLLSEARPPQSPSIIPQQVGAGSPIQHIIYIIKENRTYDQVFGDLPHANGDANITIFGEKVTPNQHALAKQYVTLDNLYCDGEVSVDGHSWSNSAYATDFNEKQWPPQYGAHSSGSYSVRAMVPSAGHLWDLAKRKGFTYRSYGENAARASTGDAFEAGPGAEGLVGHVSPGYGRGLKTRDTDKVDVFLEEFKQYAANFDSADPTKRMPNYIVMSMGEDHTEGTKAGTFTPVAHVANNDYAIGQLVDAVSHSKYWPTTAIFIIEDDAQDGADHVDARRTVGLVISPYVKRGITDSTLYTTSSMVRSMELLLGLPPMSQYDAAAMPMYASFATTPTATAFDVMQPQVDVNDRNKKNAPGSKDSARMNFSDFDRAPMHQLNQVIWESVRGAGSPMPAPVHRFRPLVDPSESPVADKDDRD